MIPESMDRLAQTQESATEHEGRDGCDRCGSHRFQAVLEKASSTGELYRVMRCRQCGLVQVHPRPDLASLRSCYESAYFEKRTDRGYADYYSPELRREIRRVYDLNLRDLGFFEYERDLRGERRKDPIGRSQNSAGGEPEPTGRALDIGCAAGYFVEHLRERGWEAEGIEISPAASRFGRESLGLKIHTGDFLAFDGIAPASYDLVTLWASLEHMPSPMAVLRRAHELLRPGGRMLLSTCRYGALAKMRGVHWRYMNVPEHLFFFDRRGMVEAARDAGFVRERFVSYGSGLTSRPGAGLLYRTAKRIADPLVKLLNQGDMMALHLRKI